MKIYKEIDADYPPYMEVTEYGRLPLVIDETQLRKADFSIRKQTIEESKKPDMPYGFPHNYPLNDKPKVETKTIYIYTIDLEFNDGEEMTIEYHDKSKALWLDAMDLITGLDHDLIFGKKGDVAGMMNAASSFERYMDAYERYLKTHERVMKHANGKDVKKG